MFSAIHEEAVRLKQLDRLQWMMDLAEAINVAYVASQPDPKGKRGTNIRKLRTWMWEKRSMRDKLLKRSRKTFWDRPGGRKARAF